MNEYLVFCAQRMIYSLYSYITIQSGCLPKLQQKQHCDFSKMSGIFFSMDNEILILFTKTENAPKVDVKFNHRFLLFISIELDNQSHTENPPVTFQRCFEIITFCAYSIRKNYWISTATKKNIVEWIVLYLRAYVIWYLFCYDGYKVYLLLDKPFNPTFFKKS